MRAVISGATGLVGNSLLAALEEPVVLSRHPDAARQKLGDGVRVHGWNPMEGFAPVEAFENADVVFHLAGEPVAAGRWTSSRKQAIQDSRVVGTRNLIAALASLDTPPRVLVCASAVGYYGHRGDDKLLESAGPAATFLASVCQQWEAEARTAEKLGVRVVTARIGLVLAPKGGALARMATPFRLGLGGRLGTGRQWMPWIHIDDVVGLFLHAAATETIEGPMNVVSPAPVTNRDFTKSLGRALGRPTIFPVPPLGLRALFGEMSDILLESQRALPGVALATNYVFRHTNLTQALRSCLGSQTSED